MPRIARPFRPAVDSLEGRVALSGDVMLQDPTASPGPPLAQVTPPEVVITPMDPILLGGGWLAEWPDTPPLLDTPGTPTTVPLAPDLAPVSAYVPGGSPDGQAGAW